MQWLKTKVPFVKPRKRREEPEEGRSKKEVFFHAMFEAAVTVVSAAATAAVLYYLLPFWLGLMILTVLILHEFGHYFAAYLQRQVPDLPIFIPLVFTVFGMTRVHGMPMDERGQIILLWGPLVGLLAAIAFLIAAIIIAEIGSAMFIAAVWMIVFQLYSATLGSDGRKFWRIRRARTQAAQAAAATA